MNETRHKIFIQILTRLAQVQGAVTDLFFQRRLAEHIQVILDSYIQFQIEIQNQSAVRRYLQSVKSGIDFLDELSHVNVCLDEIALRVAQERMLVAVRELLSRPKVSPSSVLKKTEPIKISSKIPSRLSSTTSKILDFVRKAPERRTKEIIEEFGALSGRTVKRSLRELSQEGLIVRKADNNAVYYSAA